MTVNENQRAQVGQFAIQRGRWHWGEAVFWLLAVSCVFLFPNRYLILTEIAWLVHVSYKTIANTASLMRQKLGVRSSAELVRFAIDCRLA